MRRRRPAAVVSLVIATTAAITVAVAAPARAECFDRRVRPHTSVVDSHFHLRPFGGPGIPFTEVAGYWRETGVRYVNLYGIGQMLPADSPCTYYLDCPGTPVRPGMQHDFQNADDTAAHPVDGVHITLSMSFPDLAEPAGILDGMRVLDAKYPGRFTWMGEVNLIKQALAGNDAEPATIPDILAWRPFMDDLRDRHIPITIHSDAGNDADPLEYLYLVETVLTLYPDNKIVWAHLGLSKELTTIDPVLHIAALRRLMDQHPNLYADLSWRVLYDAYFSRPAIRDRYVEFLDEYSDRVITGTDFVASRNKGFSDYREELDVTSAVNEYLSDNAFRDIALGQSYFDLLGLPEQAPPVCPGG